MDNLGHWWSLLAVVLIIVEILTAGFVLGSLGAAAFVTAIVAYIGFPIEFQFIVFYRGVSRYLLYASPACPKIPCAKKES